MLKYLLDGSSGGASVTAFLPSERPFPVKKKQVVGGTTYCCCCTLLRCMCALAMSSCMRPLQPEIFSFITMAEQAAGGVTI